MKKLPSLPKSVTDPSLMKTSHSRQENSRNLPPTIDRRKEQKVSPRQRAFIEHFFSIECGRDATKAAIAAGYSKKNASSLGGQLLNPKLYPLVAKEIRERMDILDGKAMMDADGVLRYIHTAMLYRPLEWFRPSKDGGWMIDEEQLMNLPPEIGCLIEEVESKVTVTRKDETGEEVVQTWMKVKLVSKTAMTALAAKHQLSQKFVHELSGNIDWDTVIEKAAERRANNPIALRLAAVSREAIEAKAKQIEESKLIDMSPQEGDENESSE